MIGPFLDDPTPRTPSTTTRKTREPRFELVHTDAGWHSRFRASNGRIVWATEVYTRSIAALRAISAVAHFFSPTHQLWVETKQPEIRYGSTGHDTYSTAHRLPVRVVDERTAGAQ